LAGQLEPERELLLVQVGSIALGPGPVVPVAPAAPLAAPQVYFPARAKPARATTQ